MTDAPAPARRRPAVADLLCGAGLVANTVLGVALVAATPRLLAHHAVLLEALTSSPVAMVTGGALARVGRASLLLVVLAPLCGVLLYDAFLWWAGRRWGGPLLHLYARRPGNRWAARADGWVRDHGVRVVAVAYFLPVPNPVLYAVCGAAGMPLALFVLGDAVGTLLWTGLLVGLGEALGRRGVTVVDGIEHYSTGVTLGLVALLVAVRLVRRRRRTALVPEPGEH